MAVGERQWIQTQNLLNGRQESYHCGPATSLKIWKVIFSINLKKIKYMLMVFTVALIENQNVLLLSVTVLKVTSTKALPAGFVEEGSLRESEEMMME